MPNASCVNIMPDNSVQPVPTDSGSPPDDAPLLRLEGLHFGYTPGRRVIHDISAVLEAGRLCAIIGPNAAGKSTLMKLMFDDCRPQRGDVRLAGRAVHAMSARERARQISYVPQQGLVSFGFTVEQVVAMGRFAHQDGGVDADHPAVRDAMARLDITDLADRIYGQLSGGQQQRVMLARALAQSRGSGRLMLLDEPASHLDLWHVHQLMLLLRELASQGMGILIVLHDVNLAARYADDIWLIDQGRLVAAGPWPRVLLPTVLEPVYRVRFLPVSTDLGKNGEADADASPVRPLFLIEP